MNGGGININITGGGAQFGNLQQGDHNTATVGSQTLSVEAAQAFAEIGAALDARMVAQPDDRQQVEQLKADLAELKTSVETKQKSRWGTIGEAAKALHETYGWAAPLLKTLFGVLIPGLALF